VRPGAPLAVRSFPAGALPVCVRKEQYGFDGGLAAVFAAISTWCSSLTGNAVIAFLLSAFACIILYFGFSAISKLPVFTGNADYYIEMQGIDFHYQSISRGVIDTRDVIYFASLIFLFLFATKKSLTKK